jgi:lysozyme
MSFHSNGLIPYSSSYKRKYNNKNNKMMEIKAMDSKGIDFLVNEEGLILHPYKDSVGVPTIGVGCTYYEDGTKVKMTDPAITRERAIALFKNVLKNYETTVWSVTRDDINQNQFNALVSICFNIGVAGFKGSTLLKKVNASVSDPSIADAFKMWKNAGGKPLLLGRRTREAALYFS